jgi:hypothetical protein
MVPVKDAINNATWLQCEERSNLFEANLFRIKLNSFKKLNLSEVDEPEKIEELDSNGVLWIMNLELVNLNKQPLRCNLGPGSLILLDQEHFVFPITRDYHLRLGSKFSKSSGMERFHNTDLLPKIKAVGSIIFQLPDDDDAEYFISLEDKGVVQEV